MRELKEIVFESLDNAVESGYPMLLWDDEAIADDMVGLVAELEEIEEPQVLIPYIQLWKAKKAREE